MNNLPSRIVVGGCLAIVVSGLVAYAVHIASVPVPTAQVAPLAPPPAAVQTPEPPAAPADSAPTAQAPAAEAPPAVATTEPAPATPSEAQPASNQKPAKALKRARVTDDTVVAAAPPTAPPAGPSAQPAVAAPDAVAATNTSQDAASQTDSAVADSKITTEVKSILAADAVTRDADLNVNTTQGVVVLSGTLSSQDALDHVKVVAQNVPDVKRVDTSAVKLTST